MLALLIQWYRRRFSDPEAIALLVILPAAFFIFFFSDLLAPLLCSEAVNLHPLVILLAVVIFGGWWGFWGVFFAIPLATLIKAVVHAWPDETAKREVV